VAVEVKYQQPRTDTRIMVIVSVYGSERRYMDLAFDRAIPSARRAAGVDNVIFCQQATLQAARNTAPQRVCPDADWLVFLDADDELDVNYVDAMRRKIEGLPPGDFIIQPATLGVVDGVEDAEPVLIPPKASLWDGNHCVIGSAVPCALFNRVGGFDDWPAWEDWGLWLKCLKAGAEFTSCPDAVYRVHIDTEHRSRNEIDNATARHLFNEMRNYYQRWELPEQ
jgi:hypothetical protein